ncbi:MAG: hypothetical protein II686_00925 [Bacteroidales bacterium]|nr:hypothetical protein [Bacteroidales bacterium]
MKPFSKIALVLLCLISVACKKETDPSVLIYTTIENISQHKVSVSMVENSLKGETYSFTLLPGGKYDIRGRVVFVEVMEATVTYDDGITIVHNRTGDNIPEEFRNMCYAKWWENRYDDTKGVIFYRVFTFTDKDYDYAVKCQ